MASMKGLPGAMRSRSVSMAVIFRPSVISAESAWSFEVIGRLAATVAAAAEGKKLRLFTMNPLFVRFNRSKGKCRSGFDFALVERDSEAGCGRHSEVRAHWHRRIGFEVIV